MKQLFSLDNFLLIYNYENRKGNFSDKIISNRFYKASLKLLDINTQIKQEKKDKILQNELSKIIKNIKQNDFQFNFNNFLLNDKTVYTLH